MKLAGQKLRTLLAEHEISITSLAMQSDIAASAISASLGGYEKFGEKRIQRVQRALRHLGLKPEEIASAIEP